MLLLQPLRMSFLIWSSWKQECSKLSQALLLKICTKREYGQKRGLSGVDRSKIILHEWGHSGRQISENLNWSSVKTAVHQAVTRYKTFGSFQDLSRAGKPRVTSQRDDHMIKKMVVRSPTTLSKKIWSNLLLTRTDANTFALKRSHGN